MGEGHYRASQKASDALRGSYIKARADHSNAVWKVSASGGHSLAMRLLRSGWCATWADAESDER